MQRRLTQRQLDALTLVAADYSYQQAATKLGISHHTFHHYVSEAMVRLGVGSAASAIAKALLTEQLTLDDIRKVSDGG